MRRFYVSPDDIVEGVARLDPSQSRHLVRVLRMRPGDEVILFDGESEFVACIAEIRPKEVALNVIGKIDTRPHLPFEFRLAQALIKGPRMDWLIEKATELGVKRITPVSTARCVIQKDAESGAKVSRYRKIAQSAAAQSGRKDIPEIESPRSFEEIIREQADLKVLLWEDEQKSGMDSVLHEWDRIKSEKPPYTITLMIGPEGGFTTEEVKSAVAQGWVTWGLGSLTLRSETASIAGMAILIHTLAGRLR